MSFWSFVVSGFDVTLLWPSGPSTQHSRRIGLAKVAQPDTILKQPVNLFQGLALALWYAEVSEYE